MTYEQIENEVVPLFKKVQEAEKKFHDYRGTMTQEEWDSTPVYNKRIIEKELDWKTGEPIWIPRDTPIKVLDTAVGSIIIDIT